MIVVNGNAFDPLLRHWLVAEVAQAFLLMPHPPPFIWSHAVTLAQSFVLQEIRSAALYLRTPPILGVLPLLYRIGVGHLATALRPVPHRHLACCCQQAGA